MLVKGSQERLQWPSGAVLAIIDTTVPQAINDTGSATGISDAARLGRV